MYDNIGAATSDTLQQNPMNQLKRDVIPVHYSFLSQS